VGQSTDAILFYGYCWDDQATLWLDGQEGGDGEAEDAEDRYARLIGIQRPAAEHPADDDDSVAAQGVKAEFRVYWDKKREACKAAGVVAGEHCSNVHPIPYVAVSESKVRATRGHPKQIEPLVVGADWDAKLATYCTIMGITPPQEKPGWWLVSMWC
jgi:hypothetical protein